MKDKDYVHSLRVLTEFRLMEQSITSPPSIVVAQAISIMWDAAVEAFESGNKVALMDIKGRLLRGLAVAKDIDSDPDAVKALLS